MMAIAGLIAGLGLACMIYRKTLLGVLIGIQILNLGSTLIFVLAGMNAHLASKGNVFGLFITLGGLAQLVVGYTLAIRLFFLKKKMTMNELRTLQQ